MIGELFDRKYRIERELGAGGMGRVYAATHVHLSTRHAIKVLKPELAHDPVFASRFVREAQVVARLKSEHVCRVVDVGTTDTGELYIVMELLVGVDLGKRVERAALAPGVAIDYVLQACDALAEAHALGMVHRDLKPANLFLAERAGAPPIIKLLDFGIVKIAEPVDAALTHTASLMGSPHYMSPEQLESAKHVDARTDIWALGVTLYQLVSARLPFWGETLSGVAIAIATKPHRSLAHVPPALAAIVDRCLAKRAAERFQTVAELAAALASVPRDASGPAFAMGDTQADDDGPAAPPAISPTLPVMRRATPRSRRMWWLPLAALVAVLGAISVGAAVKAKHAGAPPSDASDVFAASDATTVYLAPGSATPPDPSELPGYNFESTGSAAHPADAGEFDFDALLPCASGGDAECGKYSKLDNYRCGTDHNCHSECIDHHCGTRSYCHADNLCYGRP